MNLPILAQDMLLNMLPRSRKKATFHLGCVADRAFYKVLLLLFSNNVNKFSFL